MSKGLFQLKTKENALEIKLRSSLSDRVKSEERGRKFVCRDILGGSKGVRRSRVVKFAAIRLRGPGFKPRPGQKFKMRLLLHSHPSGVESV